MVRQSLQSVGSINKLDLSKIEASSQYAGRDNAYIAKTQE